jgi:predicted transcriptional regulator
MQTAVNLKDKIQKIIDNENITHDEFHQRLDMSKAGYYSMVKVNDCKLSTLYRICDLFQVPIDYLTKQEYTIDMVNRTYNALNLAEPNEGILKYKLDSCRDLNQALTIENMELRQQLKRKRK